MTLFIIYISHCYKPGFLQEINVKLLLDWVASLQIVGGAFIHVCMKRVGGRKNVVFRLCFVYAEGACNKHRVLRTRCNNFPRKFRGRSEVCSESAMVVFDPWFSQAGNQHARKKPPKLPRLLAFKKPSPNHKFYRIERQTKHTFTTLHMPPPRIEPRSSSITFVFLKATKTRGILLRNNIITCPLFLPKPVQFNRPAQKIF